MLMVLHQSFAMDRKDSAFQGYPQSLKYIQSSRYLYVSLMHHENPSIHVSLPLVGHSHHHWMAIGHLVAPAVDFVRRSVASALAICTGEPIGGELLASGRPRVTIDLRAGSGRAATCFGVVGDVLGNSVIRTLHSS